MREYRTRLFKNAGSLKVVALRAGSAMAKGIGQSCVRNDPTVFLPVVEDDAANTPRSSTQDDVTMVGEAVDGPSGIKLYQALRPDFAVVDLRLPDMDNVAVLEAIRRVDPAAHCLVLSHYEGDENIFRAIRAGASGYLTKQAPGSEILTAIRTVFTGKRYVPPDIASQLADRFGQTELTKREQEVLEHVSQGKSNRAIGESMQISERTIATYVGAIMSKLGAKSRTEAASRGRTRELLPKN